MPPKRIFYKKKKKCVKNDVGNVYFPVEIVRLTILISEHLNKKQIMILFFFLVFFAKY